MPVVTAPNRPWLPQEIADVADEEGVDLSPFDNPAKGTVAYWVRAGCAAAVALANSMEALGAFDDDSLTAAPWDAVTNAADSIVDAVADTAGDIADAAEDLWNGTSRVVTDTLGFGSAVAQAAAATGALLTDAIGVLDSLGDMLVPDGDVPYGDAVACLPRALGRSVGPAMVGGLIGAVIPGFGAVSTAAVVGGFNTAMEMVACTTEREQLGDRVFVVAHDRNGRPVTSYFRSRPDVERSLVASPGIASFHVSDGREFAADTGALMPTAIKTYGNHPDAPPAHMLTGVRLEHMVKLNERTNDGRLLRDTGFDTRELPLPFSAMTTTQHGEAGQATVVGMVDRVVVNDDGTVDGLGWLMDSPEARLAGKLMQAQVVRGNSVELSVRDYEVDIDFESMKIQIDFTDYQLSATTLVANPAMEGCFVYLEEPDFDFGAKVPDAVLAAASSFTAGPFTEAIPALGIPVGAGAFTVLEIDSTETSPDVPADAPPSTWFSDPGFTEVTPGRILAPDDQGRTEVYGHIASWDTPHLGVPGASMFAPRSRTGYAYFANGEVLTASGDYLPVGVLTYGGPHADKALDWREAQAHYDDSCHGWAAVAVGEDEFGIWYHGYVLPGTDPDTVARCRSLGISGDWRRVGGNLELVGALSVNARGFPLARPSAFSSAGRQTCLTGAGALAMPEANVLAEAVADGVYIPLDPESRVAINLAANFARRMEVREIREELLADQAREVAAITDGVL